MIINPKETPLKDLHQYLVGAVAPRPIAFASTVDKEGNPNLAPYSFFNVFSSNPPTLIFSSNRKVKNNTTKDTLHNIKETMEVVINVVSYAIVRQMAVTSIEFPSEINEFEKSGLTPIASTMVKPFRVKESPINMECKVKEIISLGDQGGAGNLFLCEILCMHINQEVLDEDGRINPHKIDLMGRLGRAYYTRASGEAIYQIIQPVNQISIGYDHLPESIKKSDVFTGNNIGRFAGLKEVPSQAQVLNLKNDPQIKAILKTKKPLIELHRQAQRELSKENLDLAAKIAWLGELL